jgi:hypothetical protein
MSRDERVAGSLGGGPAAALYWKRWLNCACSQASNTWPQTVTAAARHAHPRRRERGRRQVRDVALHCLQCPLQPNLLSGHFVDGRQSAPSTASSADRSKHLVLDDHPLCIVTAHSVALDSAACCGNDRVPIVEEPPCSGPDGAFVHTAEVTDQLPCGERSRYFARILASSYSSLHREGMREPTAGVCFR